jgi:hypothetical protein
MFLDRPSPHAQGRFKHATMSAGICQDHPGEITSHKIAGTELEPRTYCLYINTISRRILVPAISTTKRFDTHDFATIFEE